MGIEPLHPMFCADPSVITTLGEANRLAGRFPGEHVGVVVDAYHVWWDRAWSRRSPAPASSPCTSTTGCCRCPPAGCSAAACPARAAPTCHRLYRAITEAGYAGPVEVEVLSERVSDMSPDALLARLTEEADAALGLAAQPATEARWATSRRPAPMRR